MHYAAAGAIAVISFKEAKAAGMTDIQAGMYTGVNAAIPTGIIVRPSTFTGIERQYNMHDSEGFKTIIVRPDGNLNFKMGQTRNAPWIMPSELEQMLNK